MQQVRIDPAVIQLGTAAQDRTEKRVRASRRSRSAQKRAARKHLAAIREARWR